MDQTESLILSARDIDFCLYEWLEVERLLDRPRFSAHERHTFDGVLDLSRQLAEEKFAPHNRAADLAEPHIVDGKVEVVEGLDEALTAYADAGLLASTMDETISGFQLPHVVHRAAFMWLQAANVASASYSMLTMAAAHLIHEHATKDLAEAFLPPLLDGRWFGTMNLSEPDVGSALGDLTTRARRLADGTYRVQGRKMWISGGDHELAENIVHLVLARTGAPGSGTRGLSLLLVPKWIGDDKERVRNDVVLMSLNHKMGYRGTVNTALAYGSGEHPVGDEPGAVGYLIGEEGHGLSYMFLMMNEARIGVGAAAAALGSTGYLHARAHARVRLQGRRIGEKSSNVPVPIIQHPDVRRMLLASKAYTEGATALVLYSAMLLDDAETAETAGDREAAEILLDVLTPIVKSWPSQWCLVANDLAIQVLGGSGYVRDSPVEQFYRDNRLNPIHEGTHGIQALDLLGRKVRAHGGAGLDALIMRMRTTAKHADGVRPDLAATLVKYIERVVAVTETLWSSQDPRIALANASEYLEAVGDVVVAWLLLDQLVSVGDDEGRFYDGKRAAVTYFFAHQLPRVDAQFDLLETGDQMLVDLDDALL